MKNRFYLATVLFLVLTIISLLTLIGINVLTNSKRVLLRDDGFIFSATYTEGLWNYQVKGTKVLNCDTFELEQENIDLASDSYKFNLYVNEFSEEADYCIQNGKRVEILNSIQAGEDAQFQFEVVRVQSEPVIVPELNSDTVQSFNIENEGVVLVANYNNQDQLWDYFFEVDPLDECTDINYNTEVIDSESRIIVNVQKIAKPVDCGIETRSTRAVEVLEAPESYFFELRVEEIPVKIPEES